MPTYEYQCLKCKKKFEKLQSMMDKPLKTCVYCKKGKVERLISAGAGLIFKGSGFYQTDYKKTATDKTKEASEKKPKETSEKKPKETTNHA